jgi:hypothetical protein
MDLELICHTIIAMDSNMIGIEFQFSFCAGDVWLEDRICDQRSHTCTSHLHIKMSNALYIERETRGTRSRSQIYQVPIQN